MIAYNYKAKNEKFLPLRRFEFWGKLLWQINTFIIIVVNVCLCAFVAFCLAKIWKCFIFWCAVSRFLVPQWLVYGLLPPIRAMN